MSASGLPSDGGRPGSTIPAGSPLSSKAAFNDWLDRHARRLFIFPAVFLILIFSIFPLVASLLISFTRIRPRAGGYQIRWVGFNNFKKAIFGSEQYHLLGTFDGMGVLGWIVVIATIVLVIWWLIRYVRSGIRLVGFVGRLITASFLVGMSLLFGATLLSGNNFGTVPMTMIYVLFGCSVQFVIATGLAYLLSQPVRGRSFFRVLFFLPLMITPVGIAYQWRMLADMRIGPLSPVWEWAGLGEFAWGSNAWAARTMVMLADGWMWIPFIFVVMLAALETVGREQVEAAEVDGAGKWLIFRDITWPQIAPVAGTVVLIRWIEGFKLIDIPNVMTNGGPGIATETLTMHAWTRWRSLDFAGSSAVAYTLLIVAVIVCVSFFNFVIRKHAQK